ncbi:allantoicase [Pelagibacteraceae bacterium]|nr:allantoicase [Pelagibacteraceae bacterium]
MKKNKNIILNGLIDLAQPRLGTKVVYRTDDFFAAAKRIIDPSPPVFKEGVFDKNGKWMDGWETRRKRKSGHDYLILKLGKPGRIHKVDIDTSHFNGNQPSQVSLDVCSSKKNVPDKNQKWTNILGKKFTGPNRHHFFNVKKTSIITHVRLNIFPDGGVARLRLFGELENKKFGNKTINLTSVLNGSVPIACNNEHFGKAENVLAPGQGKNMGDGWETRRSRGKNFDWLIIRCAAAAKIDKIQIDTHHFKGNYPDQCSIQAAYVNGKSTANNIINKSKSWKLLLNKSKLHAHKKHNFLNKLMKKNKVNYLRINIFPDGGISRIRVFGKAQ